MKKYDFITLGKTVLTQKSFKAPKNSFVKPDGGIWACRYTPDEEFVSEWQRWCKFAQFPGNWNQGVVFNLKPNARIYTIDSYEDLERLAKQYKYKRNLSISGMVGICFQYLDFEALAKVYDAIELTGRGQSETRFSEPYNLYGWDVASILILNFDAIADQQPIETVKDYGGELIFDGDVEEFLEFCERGE